MPTYAPCKNPNCSHRGQGHPNCHCYNGVSTQRLDKAGLTRPGTTTAPIGSIAGYAKGGEVSGCNGPHKQDCMYYMANGGEVADTAQQESPTLPIPQVTENPAKTLGSAAVQGGLLGLMQNTGHSDLVNFSLKHSKILSDAKEQKNQFGNHLAKQDYDRATESVQGPLTGQVSKEKLKPIIQRLHPEIMQRDPHPEAFRSAVNYLHTSMKGGNKLKDYISGLIGTKKELNVKVDDKTRDKLKDHLSNLSASPELALNIGGNLSHYLPGHAAQLGALTGAATNYLQSIKPQQTSMGPLDPPAPISDSQQESYHRQLDIAQQPLTVLEHVKNGTVLPDDIKTITTIYPGLYQDMVSGINEEIIEAKTQGKEMSYARKLALGHFLGEPLDSTMTQPAMFSAMNANTPKGPPQPPEGKKPSKPSNAQNQKLADSFATNTQSREGKEEG